MRRRGVFGVAVAAVVMLLAAVLVMLLGSFITGQGAGSGSCSAGSFTLTGTVLNSTYNNATSNNLTAWNGTNVNVSIYNMSFSGFGEPQFVLYNQTNTSAANGTFRLGVAGGSCEVMYALKVVAYNISSWNALEIGPSYPPLPKQALVNLLDNSTVYLQQAATLNITAVNESSNISFSSIIFDDALGFPISEDFMSLVFNKTIIVPRAKNYTVMMMRPPQFSQGNPYSGALPPQTVAVNNFSNYSAGAQEIVVSVIKNLSFSQFIISGNITVDGKNTSRINASSLVVKLGLAGIIPPNSDLQVQNGVSINQTGGGGTHIANYSVVMMGSASGIYQILEVYGENTTTITGGEYFAYMSNFTVTGSMTHNLTLRRLAGVYASVSSGGAASLNTSYVRVNITDSSGLPLDDAHVEIKVAPVGHLTNFPTFRYMADQLSGGVISIPILNSSNATVHIFNRRYAPLRVALNISNASQEPNGIIQVKMNTFKPRKYHSNGTFEDFSGSKASEFRFTFMRNSNACNVFNASVQDCRLFPNDFDAAKFDPLKVMVSGKVNLLMEINTTGVKMYFIGVDMIASGPPEASMSENALRKTVNGSSYQEVFKFGSVAPPIYDSVLVGLPYNHSIVNENKQINFSLAGLFDGDGNLVWNASQTPNASIPSDWSDFPTELLNTTYGGARCYDSAGANVSNTTCYVNLTTNYIWVKLPHFSDSEGGIQSEADALQPLYPPNATAANFNDSDADGNINIGWNDTVNETGETYAVYRFSSNISTFNSSLLNITTPVRVPEGRQFFQDNTSVHGTNYWYAVVAVDSAGNLNTSVGFPNLSMSFNVTANDTVRPRPTLNLTLSTSDTTVTLRWLNVTQDINGSADWNGLVFRIYQSSLNATANLSSGINNVTAANMSYVKNTTANSTTVTGLSNGIYHFAVTTVDDAGNENFTVYIPTMGPFGNYGNITVTPSTSSSSSGSSSSGGSGGGGGGAAVESAGVKVARTWDVLPAGPATMTISKAEIGFTTIDFTVSKNLANVGLAVTKLATKPTVKREVQGTVYQYIRIDETNIAAADVTDAVINFKVEKKWFDQNSGSIRNIVLQRYTSDLWTTLDTKFTRSDSTHNYFEATSPGLSLFAIVLKSQVGASAPTSAGSVNVSNATAANETAASAAGGGKGFSLPLKQVLIGVAVVAIIGGIAFFVVKKRGSGDGKGGGSAFSLPKFSNPLSKLTNASRGLRPSRKSEDEEAAKIVKEYEAQQRPQQQQQDQRGRPPEAFN